MGNFIEQLKSIEGVEKIDCYEELNSGKFYLKIKMPVEENLFACYTNIIEVLSFNYLTADSIYFQNDSFIVENIRKDINRYIIEGLIEELQKNN